MALNWGASESRISALGRWLIWLFPPRAVTSGSGSGVVGVAGEALYGGWVAGNSALGLVPYLLSMPGQSTVGG
jgi:hypothetical protein